MIIIIIKLYREILEEQLILFMIFFINILRYQEISYYFYDKKNCVCRCVYHKIITYWHIY